MRTIIKAFAINGFISLIIAYIAFLVFGSILYAVILFSIILFLGLVKSTLTILNILVQRTRWYKRKVGDGIKFRKEIDTNLDICNLGSNSGKYAFSYEETGLKGENWALGPQTLSYDFRILKNYSSYLKEGATVLISLCPFSSCIRDFENDTINHKYYSFLHPIFILNYSKSTSKQVMRFVNEPFLVSPVKSLIRLFKDVSVDNVIEMNKDEIEINANEFITIWKDQFSISNLDAPVSKENMESVTYNTNLLLEMISFCFERKLKPVIVIPPVSKALHSKFSETFCENYIYSFIHRANNKQIPFLNYFDEQQFAENNLYFNSYFLNENGRKLFTKKVLKDLQLID